MLNKFQLMNRLVVTFDPEFDPKPVVRRLQVQVFPTELCGLGEVLVLSDIISCPCVSGSYYLTTTYGALEHIKTFDQQRSATRQLSREVQDSIHRWERRRTLNQERSGHDSVRVQRLYRGTR